MLDIKRTLANSMYKAKPPPGTPVLVNAVMAERIVALGQRIRAARMHRQWRQVDLAERAGLSRSTIEAIERGEPGTAIGAYVQVLWTMGLDRELDLVADPGLDREGLALTISTSDKRVRPTRKLDNAF
jgi:transcriptional regulator with XRE-family HTH domain